MTTAENTRKGWDTLKIGDWESLGTVLENVRYAFTRPTTESLYAAHELDEILPVEPGAKLASEQWANARSLNYALREGQPNSHLQLMVALVEVSASLLPGQLQERPEAASAKIGLYLRAAQRGAEDTYHALGESCPRDVSEAYTARLINQALALGAIDQHTKERVITAQAESGLEYTPLKRYTMFLRTARPLISLSRRD